MRDPKAIRISGDYVSLKYKLLEESKTLWKQKNFAFS